MELTTTRRPGRHDEVVTVIENPLSGERITIQAPAAQNGGTLLAWELPLAPGGRVPSGLDLPGWLVRRVVAR